MSDAIDRNLGVPYLWQKYYDYFENPETRKFLMQWREVFTEDGSPPDYKMNEQTATIAPHLDLLNELRKKADCHPNKFASIFKYGGGLQKTDAFPIAAAVAAGSNSLILPLLANPFALGIAGTAVWNTLWGEPVSSSLDATSVLERLNYLDNTVIETDTAVINIGCELDECEADFDSALDAISDTDAQALYEESDRALRVATGDLQISGTRALVDQFKANLSERSQKGIEAFQRTLSSYYAGVCEIPSKIASTIGYTSAVTPSEGAPASGGASEVASEGTPEAAPYSAAVGVGMAALATAGLLKSSRRSAPLKRIDNANDFFSKWTENFEDKNAEEREQKPRVDVDLKKQYVKARKRQQELERELSEKKELSRALDKAMNQNGKLVKSLNRATGEQERSRTQIKKLAGELELLRKEVTASTIQFNDKVAKFDQDVAVAKGAMEALLGV